MKKHFLLVTIVSLFAYITLSSNGAGTAKKGNGNRTGSPGTQNCSTTGCHTGFGVSQGVTDIFFKKVGSSTFSG